MAHADIFERISREQTANKKQVVSVNNMENKTESSIDKKAIETLKILGKQLIDMKELVDEQTKIINALQEEILRLKKRQTETKGDIEMVVIDQRDVAKQLRMLKAVVTGEMHVNNRIQQEQNPQFHQSAPQQVYHPLPTQNSQANHQMPQNPYYDSSPEAVAKKFYNNYDQSALFNNPNPQSSQSVNQSQPRQGVDHSRHAESVAKEFIFGRIPKLLNLE